MDPADHFTLGAMPEQLQRPFPKVQRGVSFLREGARRFAAQQGRTYDPEGPTNVQSDPQFQTRVARSYEHTPVLADHRVRKAYGAFTQETNAQFDYLTRPRTEGGLGLNVQFTNTDPYPHHQALQDDVLRNRRLQVLRTEATGGQPHPYLDSETNDKFRAVHDALGHASIGSSFSRTGEEQAYASHAQLYSPEALPALTTETRGQASTLTHGSNPGTFPEQKPILLPSWAMKNRLPKS